jgi:hypothetical protein
MAALEDVSKISVRVESLAVIDGRRVSKAVYDADGYTEQPVAVLGIATRNSTYYNVGPFVGQLTSSDSYINRMLSEGTLYGEYAHPDVASLPKDQVIPRLLKVDENNISHHFRGINTGTKLNDGGILLMAKMRPFGPKGQYLKESLDSSHINTSFSLRSIAKEQRVGAIIKRDVLRLVTFDMVAAGGYMQASKRFAGAVESFDQYFELSPEDFTSGIMLKNCAMESIRDHQLNDIFQTKNIKICSTTYTNISGSTLLSQVGTCKKRSLFEVLMSEGRT